MDEYEEFLIWKKDQRTGFVAKECCLRAGCYKRNGGILTCPVPKKCCTGKGKCLDERCCLILEEKLENEKLDDSAACSKDKVGDACSKPCSKGEAMDSCSKPCSKPCSKDKGEATDSCSKPCSKPCSMDNRESTKPAARCADMEAWTSPLLCSVDAREHVELDGQNDVDETRQVEHVAFSVDGMDCSTCATALDGTLRKHLGVVSCQVNYLSRQAEVRFEPSATSPESIRMAIEHAGYSAVLLNRQKDGETSFLVESMQETQSAMSEMGALRGVLLVSLSPHKAVAVGAVILECRFDPDATGPRKVLQALGSRYSLFTPTFSSEADAVMERNEFRSLLIRLIIAVCFTVPLICIAFFFPLNSELNASLSRIVQGRVTLSMILSFVFCTIVMVALAPPLYKSAYRSLRYKRTFNMSFLVMLSTTVAYLYSVAVFFALFASPPALSNEVFFETPAILLTLVTIGTLLEKIAMRKSRHFVSNLKGMHVADCIIVDHDGQESVISADLIGRGDRIKIIPGSRIPMDGIVVEGVSSVDESLLTGEALPVKKAARDRVFAGTVNQEGVLFVDATRMPSESTLAKMCQFVDAALAERLPVERMADKISHYFVPIALCCGIATFFVWFALAYTGTVATTSPPVLFALRFAVAVLVVSCPCAIALAVPTVVVVATGVAAKNGVLVKGATIWEAARKLDTCVFDKTGSLTMGKLHVVELEVLDSTLSCEEALRILASAESNSEHLIGKAIMRHAFSQFGDDFVATKPENFKALPGLGVECTVGPVHVLAGNLALMKQRGVEISERMSEQALESSARGHIAVYLAVGESLKACITVNDVVRSESRDVVAHLLRRGVDVRIVSGDALPAVSRIAQELGIAQENICGGVSPEGKAEEVVRLQKMGRSVAMVGDGCNDAAALAVADVGIAIGGGTEMATSAAGAVLMRDHLDGVLVVFELARSVHRRIIINFIWAFGYNIIAIPLAVGFFWPLGVYIPPAIAGASELLSSVPVIVLSLLLGLWRHKYRKEDQ